MEDGFIKLLRTIEILYINFKPANGIVFNGVLLKCCFFATGRAGPFLHVQQHDSCCCLLICRNASWNPEKLMKPSARHRGFHAPLTAEDSEKQTDGCRHSNPDFCSNHSLSEICAFVRKDGMCFRPPMTWPKQFFALKSAESTSLRDGPEDSREELPNTGCRCPPNSTMNRTIKCSSEYASTPRKANKKPVT